MATIAFCCVEFGPAESVVYRGCTPTQMLFAVTRALANGTVITLATTKCRSRRRHFDFLPTEQIDVDRFVGKVDGQQFLLLFYTTSASLSVAPSAKSRKRSHAPASPE